MPNTLSGKKTLRSSGKKKVFNLRRKAKLHKETKELRKLVEGKKKKEADAQLPSVYKAIDKAQKRGLIKKNTASRKKALAAKIVKNIA